MPGKGERDGEPDTVDDRLQRTERAARIPTPSPIGTVLPVGRTEIVTKRRRSGPARCAPATGSRACRAAEIEHDLVSNPSVRLRSAERFDGSNLARKPSASWPGTMTRAPSPSVASKNRLAALPSARKPATRSQAARIEAGSRRASRAATVFSPPLTCVAKPSENAPLAAGAPVASATGSPGRNTTATRPAVVLAAPRSWIASVSLSGISWVRLPCR